MRKAKRKIKRKLRNRKKIKEVNTGKYRVSVFKSLKNISAQIIDDKLNKTLVSASSTEKEIKKAYRKLAIKNHPDKGGDAELFKKISGGNVNYRVKNEPTFLQMINFISFGHFLSFLAIRFFGKYQL